MRSHMQDAPIVTENASAASGRQFRYYDFVMAAFVAILLLSNLIGAAKLADVGGYIFGAGILFFPLGYVIGDVLTEVYGYARARRVIWVGFVALIFMAFMSWVVVALPPAAGWEGQAAYEAVFGQVWRIVFASITAFWAGEFVNSYVMARMKIWTQGKHLWTRTIGSTVVGQGVDSLIFYPLAFWGVWSNTQVITVMITNWLLKVGWEVVLTPVTYAVVGWLKRKEGVDIFDEDTDFYAFQDQGLMNEKLQSLAELWIGYKIQLVEFVGLTNDAMHVHGSILILFVSALILRRRPDSIWCWLIVFAAELFNEFADLKGVAPGEATIDASCSRPLQYDVLADPHTGAGTGAFPLDRQQHQKSTVPNHAISRIRSFEEPATV